LLQRCPLFSGINSDETEKLLTCLSAVQKKYEKGSPIFLTGEKLNSVGIVLSGCIHIVQDDFWGNRTIAARFEPVELFGEAISNSETKKLPISIMAAEKSEILWINYKKIITTCSSACLFHTALIKNIIQDLAQKNIMLMQKLECITRRTTREKLLFYLSLQAGKGIGNTIEIPFKRQELADYLSIDRSAMSSELGKLRDEGILRFNKNKFELLKQ
jgi:CRP-like cAMP-binding protein